MNQKYFESQRQLGRVEKTRGELEQELAESRRRLETQIAQKEGEIEYMKNTRTTEENQQAISEQKLGDLKGGLTSQNCRARGAAGERARGERGSEAAAGRAEDAARGADAAAGDPAQRKPELLEQP